MANFVFESATQAQAATFASGDFLIFGSSNATAVNVTVVPTAPSDQLTQNGVSITSEGKTLTFNLSNLSASSTLGRVIFNNSSNLVLGTGIADSSGGTASGTLNVNAGFAGTTAADVVYGFGGADSLGGGNGADYLYGGNGADTLNGDDGNDHLYGNALGSQQGASDGNDVINGGNGADYINGNAGDDTLDGGDGSDRIFGGNGADSISGGTGADQINGNLGDDTILGGDGNDILRGGQGNDIITGGADNDIIYGDLGTDTLTGGAGLDVLFGGDGGDRFVFAAGDAAFTTQMGATNANITDVIADYVDGTDVVALGFAVTTVTRDTQGTTFATLQAAQTYAQQLADNSTAVTTGEVVALRFGSDTYLFYNGTNGGATLDSAIKMLNVNDPTLITTTDFV